MNTTRQTTTRRGGCLVGERGAAVVELIVLAPILILAISFIAWSGRQPGADGEIRAAARSAARAAALERDPGQAVVAGELAGRTAAGLEFCSRLDVSVDISRWQDGWVSATVVCDVSNQGLVFDAGSLARSWSERVQQAGRI